MKKTNNKGIALSQPKGFTLIELLLYMLIFPILLLVLGNLFGSVVDRQLESKSYSSIDLDGRYVLAKLAYDFQSADSANPAANSIIIPAAKSSGSELQIKINSVIHTYKYSTVQPGRLILENPIASELTSADSTISNLNFERIGPGDNTDSIRIKFRLTSNIQKKSGPEYRDFQTTLAFP